MSTITPASDKQLAFITRLLGEKDTTGTRYEGHTTSPVMGKAAASDAITDLMLLPRKQGTRQHAEPGYYVADNGDMFVVVANRAKTNTYAKALTNSPKENGAAHWSWTYAPGVAAMLAGSHPLTIQEAAEFGHLHGICFKCLKPLTDPKSVEAGMGPVCRKALA